jgi:uncharacterized protein involved in oxidation of intracellular sulfur
VLVFLMADAVASALPAQATPQGYYNIERMVKPVVSRGGQVRLCGACCEARGIRAIPLLEGAEISTMSQLAQWTVESARVLVFQLYGNNTPGQTYMSPCGVVMSRDELQE